MKKLLYFAAVVIAATASVSTATSCKFAPSQNDGDTVAASEFYPEDTSALHAKKMARIKAQKSMTDSVVIYYIGSESSKEKLQLVSYPSRRDTFEYGKTRRIKVKGCADPPPAARAAPPPPPAPAPPAPNRFSITEV